MHKLVINYDPSLHALLLSITFALNRQNKSMNWNELLDERNDCESWAKTPNKQHKWRTLWLHDTCTSSAFDKEGFMDNTTTAHTEINRPRIASCVQPFPISHTQNDIQNYPALNTQQSICSTLVWSACTADGARCLQGLFTSMVNVIQIKFSGYERTRARLKSVENVSHQFSFSTNFTLIYKFIADFKTKSWLKYISRS